MVDDVVDQAVAPSGRASAPNGSPSAWRAGRRRHPALVDDEHAALDERHAEVGELLPDPRRDAVEVVDCAHRGDLGADAVDGGGLGGRARAGLGLAQVEVAAVGEVERSGHPRIAWTVSSEKGRREATTVPIGTATA